jgi:hypothetical protein
MIDPETASEGSALIATAMGELMEEASIDALTTVGREPGAMIARAEQLKAVGADILGLAQALEILARRSSNQPA